MNHDWHDDAYSQHFSPVKLTKMIKMVQWVFFLIPSWSDRCSPPVHEGHSNVSLFKCLSGILVLIGDLRQVNRWFTAEEVVAIVVGIMVLPQGQSPLLFSGLLFRFILIIPPPTNQVWILLGCHSRSSGGSCETRKCKDSALLSTTLNQWRWKHQEQKTDQWPGRVAIGHVASWWQTPHPAEAGHWLAPLLSASGWMAAHRVASHAYLKQQFTTWCSNSSGRAFLVWKITTHQHRWQEKKEAGSPPDPVPHSHLWLLGPDWCESQRD